MRVARRMGKILKILKESRNFKVIYKFYPNNLIHKVLLFSRFIYINKFALNNEHGTGSLGRFVRWNISNINPQIWNVILSGVPLKV